MIGRKRTRHASWIAVRGSIRRRLRRLVDEPHPHAEARQPEREHQAGRAGANDQHLRDVARRLIHYL